MAFRLPAAIVAMACSGILERPHLLTVAGAVQALRRAPEGVPRTCFPFHPR